jgi:hypothetical protein
MSGQLVTVNRRVVHPDNTPAQGTVSLTPVIEAGNTAPDKRLVVRGTVSGTLDEDGSVSLHVLASDDPDWHTDGPVLYEVREDITGAGGWVLNYVVHVPGPGPVDLLDLQPVTVDGTTVAPFPVPGPPGPLQVRSTRPNVTDRLVEVWDGTAWIPVHYDSGWRDITSTLLNGWGTAVSIRVRRVDAAMQMIVLGTASTGWTAEIAADMPRGFRPQPGDATAISVPIGRASRMERIHISATSQLLLASADGYDGEPQLITFPVEDLLPTALPGTILTTAP